MRVVTVAGTRPELIKLAPLIPLLDARFEHVYLFTGQHYSPSMVQVFLDELDARAPDRWLDVGSSDPEALTVATRDALADIAPDVILAYGDTNSTLAAGIGAEELGIPLFHIEAGIRSFDRSMPEEVNRVRVDAIAALRLAPTGLATWFLTAFEGYDAVSCPAVGNLVVDAWRRHRPLIDARPAPALAAPYAVLTMHRQATVDDPEVFARALAELARVDMPILFPVHPRTTARLEAFGLEWPENIVVSEPLGYLDFCRAMSGAAVLLTDSGGVQEEAISLDIPCVTLRPNTERMETVFLGANRLFDLARDTDLAGVAARAIAEHDARPYRLNPFGDGRAAERIVALLEMLGGGETTVTFQDAPGIVGLEALRAAAATLGRRDG
ncbi:MAG: UDP-N-acetylglucosamine 2-epimerase (non-hydrolyzing) [Deltaproteobacteria bacterium]|nr:UDP-N-acetylglucosamine 2-epimerase (non-hydrolyzing) [Deltaproteobacteria bacterium]